MRYPNGLFGWADIMTRDPGRAIEFYEGLFGWTHVDQPTPMGPPYTQFYKDGKLVCGLSPMMPGVPEEIGAFWTSYILVEDADAAAAAAEAAGGTVSMPPMDVMDQGRMAMLADPTGAAVGLWQPAAHEGAELFNAPGSMTWNELQTRDIDAALPFYEKVFGWEWAETQMPGYHVANIPAKEGDDKSNAGAMSMPPGVPDEAPNLWMVYFAVEDCDTSMAAAEGLGGEIFLPAMQMGPGKFGGLVDPTGGMFLLGSF
ncbi:MAG: VOC family protein [Actinobacteria bacterium]|nr:VOC family protein [Actinomycetota bacterium]